jgi:hypothetical protein
MPIIKRNTPPPTDKAAVGAVLKIGATSKRFDHSLATTSVGIVANANWNTDVYLIELTADYFILGFSNPALRGSTVTWRLTTNGGYLSVAANAGIATLTHNLNNATAAYFPLPNWNTLVYVSSKTVNTIVYGFATPPSEAGRLYYGRYNLSSSTVLSGNTVTADAEVHSINHNLNYQWVDLFSVPTWNSAAYTLDRTRVVNAMSVGFNVPAPSGATIDVVAGIPA